MQTSPAFVFILVVLLLYIIVRPTIGKKINTTILITFDGFRWDYMTKTDTPNMDYIVKTGVKAPYINPVFPAETIPNHYSMVTGLYPESHGILSGYYTYDPVWNSSFDMNNTESRWWNDGEPVWVTNQKQGYRSGVCYFPGYDVKIRGHYPTFSTAKDQHYGKPFISTDRSYMPFLQQIDTVIKWMEDKDPPSFIAVYFREPDEVSHHYGPDSMEVVQQIKRCDDVIGYLLKRLKGKQFFERTNLIITADHGHTSFNTSTFLNFDEYIQGGYSRYGLTTIQIFPHKGRLEDVYRRFKKMENETKLISVYDIKNFPDKYHFKNNRRTPPVIAIMKEHWIGNTSGFWKIWTKEKKGEPLNRTRGDHVYKPDLMSMKPFFIAKGPGFKQGYVSKPFNIVDIYPMICHLLGVQPAPNNGSLNRVKDFFQEQRGFPMTWGQSVANFFQNAWKDLTAVSY